MPFCVTSRSERCAKRLGTHWSTAIAASVAGPATNPVCAATNSSAPSESRVTITTAGPSSMPPRFQPCVICCQSDAFSVLPGWWCTPQSR